MKKQVEIIIFLFFGLAFLVYLFPFIFVEAAKLESGVTIKAPSTTMTQKVCNTFDPDLGMMTLEDCSCGLQIVSGVPMNYGQVNPGQVSGQRVVILKNEGTSDTVAKIMIKGGDWKSDAAGNPTIFPSMNTHVAIAPNLDYDNKKSLSNIGSQLGGIAGGQSLPVYFQMKPGGAADASLNSFTGSLHQDVIIDLLC